MSMHIPEYQKGKFYPIFTQKGWNKVEENGIANKSVKMELENFFDDQGNIIMTLHELTTKHPPGTTWEKDYVANACWVIDGYFEIESDLYEIKGLQYEIPYSVGENQIIIEGGGNPKIYIKSHSGDINKLITDKDLKKVKFQNGKVIKEE